MATILEAYRKEAVERLFSVKTMQKCFPVWKNAIDLLAPARTPGQILDLGDHLSEIFRKTGTSGRDQGEVSSSGVAWESLVCWYLNLCLIGRRTVVVRHNKELIPQPISDAITVNYHNFPSNTESDLIAITFPDKEEYSCDQDDICLLDDTGMPIPTRTRGGKYQLKALLDVLCDRDFAEIEVHIVQCKTNWNDNAQIPMLWDAVYAAKTFRNGVCVGRNNYTVTDLSHFTYAFATVPTNRLSCYQPSTLCVKRVMNLTGGNYWGRETKADVAASIKEMLPRNLFNGHTAGHRTTLAAELPSLGTTYNYFRL